MLKVGLLSQRDILATIIHSTIEKGAGGQTAGTQKGMVQRNIQREKQRGGIRIRRARIPIRIPRGIEFRFELRDSQRGYGDPARSHPSARAQERETGGLGRGAKWDSGYQTTDPEGTARKMVIRRK